MYSNSESRQADQAHRTFGDCLCSKIKVLFFEGWGGFLVTGFAKVGLHNPFRSSPTYYQIFQSILVLFDNKRVVWKRWHFSKYRKIRGWVKQGEYKNCPSEGTSAHWSSALAGHRTCCLLGDLEDTQNAINETKSSLGPHLQKKKKFFKLLSFFCRWKLSF